MKRKFWLLLLLGVLLLSPAVAQPNGDIYVGGPWGTRINNLPYTISAPGSYYLDGNLSYAGTSNGITITSDHVTLDLMGFSLNYTGTGSPHGVYMNGRTNVEIRNGTIAGWNYGIDEIGAGKAHRIFNVRVIGSSRGVELNGNGHLIKNCESMVAIRGFYIQGYGVISGCLAQGFSSEGMKIGDGSLPSGGIISGNVAIGNGSTGQNGIVSGASLTSIPHTLILGNEVSNCGYHGIDFYAGSSVIGNTVNTTATGQIGIIGNNDPTTVLDQNTVLGPGTHTSHIGGAQTRNNNAW